MALADSLSENERIEIERKLLRALRMRGAAHHADVSLKIVGDFPTEGLYSYEVTFRGQRRMSVESFGSISDAQDAAVAAAMLGPKADEPEAQTAPKAQVLKQAAQVHPSNKRRWDLGEVVSEYQGRGLTPHEAWNRYIIETGLQPQFDFKDLRKAWNRR